ncbi:hypothetical protein H4R20_003709, partial [Coemansia guatemalensis]
MSLSEHSSRPVSRDESTDSADSSNEKTQEQKTEQQQQKKKKQHPYVTYRSLASSQLEAGPSILNEYFAQQPKRDLYEAPPEHGNDDKQQEQDGAETPLPQAVQRQGSSSRQGPAAAALLRSKQGMDFGSNGSDRDKEAQRLEMQPPSTNSARVTRGPGILPSADEDALAADPNADDDDVTGRKIENEIRRLMRQVHLSDESSEMHGMSERPEELRSIAQALATCMELRD